MTRSAIAAAAALLLLFSPADAQGRDASEVVEAEVRPGWRTETGTHMAALHLRLAQGWKTYWRAPGDAGIPPRFDWSGSHNLAGVRLHWPRPSVFDTAGLRTIGFADELVLPMEFSLRDPAAPAQISATVELGVCETVCIPVTLRIDAELPSGGEEDARIAGALADRPQPAQSAGLRRADCTVEPIADGLRVTAWLDMPSIGADEVTVFELSDATIWISEAHSRRNGAELTAVAEMVAETGTPFALDRSDLRITVLGDGRAAELVGCPGR